MTFWLRRTLLVLSPIHLRREFHEESTSVARKFLPKDSSQLYDPDSARAKSYEQYKWARARGLELRDAAQTRVREAGRLPIKEIEPRIGHIQKYLDMMELEYRLRKAHHDQYAPDLDSGHQRRLQALQEQIWHHKSVLQILTTRLRRHYEKTDPTRMFNNIPEVDPGPIPSSLEARIRAKRRLRPSSQSVPMRTPVQTGDDSGDCKSVSSSEKTNPEASRTSVPNSARGQEGRSGKAERIEQRRERIIVQSSSFNSQPSR